MNPDNDDFLGAMRVGDDGVTFADELGGGGEAPAGDPAPKTLTAEEQLAEANRKLERYKSLDFMADALERDPSKIHDVRGALEGKLVESSLTEHPAPPKPTGPRSVLEAIQALPQEERDKLNLLATEKPAEYQAALADLSAKIHVDQFRQSAQPLVDANIARDINDFKLSKAGELIYRHAVEHFDAEMADFNRNAYYDLEPNARRRQLDLRWAAAKARAYDAAAAKATPRSPRNVGGGSGGAGGGGTGGRIQQPTVSPEIAELAARSGLKPGQLSAIMKDVANA